MRIIPVLDLKNGKAVHAKAGNRDDYRLLETVICAGSDPVKIASAYAGMGFKELYVADLDGIASHKPDVKLIDSIASESGLKVMADIGLRNVPGYNTYEFSPIVSSESLTNLVDVGDSKEFVFSIDTKRGILINTAGLTLADLVKWLAKHRFKDTLLLDLAIVGTGLGPNLKLCRHVADGLDVGPIYGCGVRGSEDIEVLLMEKASGVLIGSAIHSGAFTADHLGLFK